MENPDKPYDDVFNQNDYYLAQSMLFVEQYLADHGMSRDMLLVMPTEVAAAILKEALEAAAVQIARLDAMVRLGNREVESKSEPPCRRRQHEDRLARYFWKNSKGSTI